MFSKKKKKKKLNKKNRRLVDEYRRSGPGQPYELALEGVEFSRYMREHRGFHIIPISGDVRFILLFLSFDFLSLLFLAGERKQNSLFSSFLSPPFLCFPSQTPPPSHTQDQLLYGCNVLNLGNSKVISVHAGTARQIVRDPKFRGDVQVVDFSPITSMYGAVHCSSQVVKRTPASAAM